MHRIRLTIAVFFALVVLGVAPAFAQEGDSSGDAPAVVLEDDSSAVAEEAWTFRYLVPTLIGVTGLAVGAVVIGYGVRVRARYRVVE